MRQGIERNKELRTLIHKYGNVSQPQDRIEKHLLFVIGELLFVIESSQFQSIK